MFCPSDANTGFVKLNGPIQHQHLEQIKRNYNPLTLSFSSSVTPATLQGNKIQTGGEPTENTCTYKGTKYELIDIQLCSVIHTGYVLPGQSSQPVGELILTFSPTGGPSKGIQTLSGILLCLPIFDSGAPAFDDYLNQFIDTTLSSCNYDTQEGTLYSSPDYQQLPNVSLNNCIKTCCGDPNCLAYTFQNGTCHMKNTNTGLTNVEDKSYQSGSIDRNHPRAASQPPNVAPPISSLFFGWKGDTRQSSIAYATCFETVENNEPESHSIYVFYFVNGIHLAASTFQQLKGAMGGTLASYQAPPAIRGTKPTLLSYRFDQNGKKVVTETSDAGVIYKTALTSCSDEFVNRFDYFVPPPNLPQFSSKIALQGQYYTTSQYKCVPFNPLSDMSGEYIIPGNRDLKTLMAEQKIVQDKQTNPKVEKPKIGITEMEQIIGGTIAGVVFIIGVIFIGKTVGSNSGE